jgi:uncharacterized phage-associated protein
MTRSTRKTQTAAPKQRAAKPAQKPFNALAALQTDTYRHLSDAELVDFARSRGPWWTTRAGQIERAGVSGFRAKVRAALAKAAKAEGK